MSILLFIGSLLCLFMAIFFALTGGASGGTVFCKHQSVYLKGWAILSIIASLVMVIVTFPPQA